MTILPKLTIVAFIRNEEYLLREWLNWHHKLYQANFWIYEGGSTDRTKEILRDYSKRMNIILIENAVPVGEFSLQMANDLIKEAEPRIGSWKIWLSVTDFLFAGNLFSQLAYLQENGIDGFYVRSLSIGDTLEEKEKELDDLPIVLQRTHSHNLRAPSRNSIGFDKKFLHQQSCPAYGAGGHNIEDGREYLWSTEWFVAKLVYSPMNEEFIKRRLGIRAGMSPADLALGMHIHHVAERRRLLEMYEEDRLLQVDYLKEHQEYKTTFNSIKEQFLKDSK